MFSVVNLSLASRSAFRDQTIQRTTKELLLYKDDHDWFMCDFGPVQYTGLVLDGIAWMPATAYFLY